MEPARNILNAYLEGNRIHLTHYLSADPGLEYRLSSKKGFLEKLRIILKECNKSRFCTPRIGPYILGEYVSKHIHEPRTAVKVIHTLVKHGANPLEIIYRSNGTGAYAPIYILLKDPKGSNSEDAALAYNLLYMTGQKGIDGNVIYSLVLGLHDYINKKGRIDNKYIAGILLDFVPDSEQEELMANYILKNNLSLDKAEELFGLLEGRNTYTAVLSEYIQQLEQQ